MGDFFGTWTATIVLLPPRRSSIELALVRTLWRPRNSV
jgi:hypothetical protein